MNYAKILDVHHLIRIILAKKGVTQHSSLRVSCLAYLIDFTYFYHNFKSLSGGNYLKPASFIPEVIKHIPLIRGFRNASKEEVELINKVIQKWGNSSDEELKTFVKNTLPYRLSFEGEIIPYSLISQEIENNLY